MEKLSLDRLGQGNSYMNVDATHPMRRGKHGRSTQNTGGLFYVPGHMDLKVGLGHFNVDRDLYKKPGRLA